MKMEPQIKYDEPLWKPKSLELDLDRQVHRYKGTKRIIGKTPEWATITVMPKNEQKKQASAKHGIIRKIANWTQQEKTSIAEMANFGNKHKISEEKRLLHNRTAKEGKYHVLRKPKIVGGKVEEIIQCQLCEKATRRNGHLMEWLKNKCPKLEPKIEGKIFSEK